MQSLQSSFWAFYERREHLTVILAASLFLWQLLHLAWLALHVIAFRLTGESYFPTDEFWTIALIVVDYTEIPALITTSVLYVSDLRKQFRWKPIAFLFFINIQWLHLFWITDEFVVSLFLESRAGTILSVWLAWVAIGIDYLEVPIIIDTIRKACAIFRERGVKDSLKRVAREYVWRR